MQVLNQIEITTDYMQADLHIVKVVPTEIFPELQYAMFTIYTEDEQSFEGVCYWYDGVNKNIPFSLTRTQKSKIGI